MISGKAASLEEQVVEYLARDGLTITTAESCTGGMIASRLVNVAGISAHFKSGFVTYANEAKTKLLGVPQELLAQKGAVSPEVAEAMARGAAKAACADVAIASTGIAGPDGGTPEKPVGLVYLGCYYKGEVQVRREQFSGERQQVRAVATECALRLVLAQLCAGMKEG